MEGIGEDDALGRGVGDVALVPEDVVLQGDGGMAAQDARQPGDALAADGIALVRHGRGAFLAAGERLLDLEHLGLLQVADLDGDLLQGGAQQGQRPDDLGVAVALDDLRGDAAGLQSQPAQRLFLGGGREVDVGPHRAGDLAHRGGVPGPQQPLAVALHLLVPDQELAAEDDGLGVDAVGAADGRQVL